MVIGKLGIEYAIKSNELAYLLKTKSIIGKDRIKHMLAYELYTFDKIKGFELIGVLPERRKNTKRITRDSVMSWGRMLLGDNADKRIIYFKQITLDHTGRIVWVNSV